ncbi:AraC family transcriptional regulator [Siccirubricoccus deserti]|uniref:GlxA family transcriptional regulator n=2 Tax=Siccirubricoccus deserti TaxID=2013562 RepID=A0A9X0R4N5_9PROT|nr:GlxA family transcriptional regulator [Siccirubricoccus deserti]GGC68755.1 AraC family transcriptional regulator [Siccirubricoccus deserti]
MPGRNAIEIGLVIYPGTQLAAVLGMTDFLMLADRIAGEQTNRHQAPPLRVSHWQMRDGEHIPVRVFDTAPGVEGPPDVLILPPRLGPPIEAHEAAPFVGWLRERHSTGTALGSICTGAFLLGETGLLSGRCITTHWTFEEAFQARFPEARMDAARLLIDDGDIITAGGAMAWTDLVLKLIDRHLGPVVMMETARRLLVDPPGREQSYYSVFAPRLNHGDGAILKVQHWLQATGARDIDLATLAMQAGLEERTLLRRFQKATGLTTTEYCQRLRVGKARELLQSSPLTADQVAWEVGYADAGAFRKVFTRIVGLTPAEYRKRFRA